MDGGAASWARTGGEVNDGWVTAVTTGGRRRGSFVLTRRVHAAQSCSYLKGRTPSIETRRRPGSRPLVPPAAAPSLLAPCFSLSEWVSHRLPLSGRWSGPPASGQRPGAEMGQPTEPPPLWELSPAPWWLATLAPTGTQRASVQRGAGPGGSSETRAGESGGVQNLHAGGADVMLSLRCVGGRACPPRVGSVRSPATDAAGGSSHSAPVSACLGPGRALSLPKRVEAEGPHGHRHGGQGPERGSGRGVAQVLPKLSAPIGDSGSQLFLLCEMTPRKNEENDVSILEEESAEKPLPCPPIGDTPGQAPPNQPRHLAMREGSPLRARGAPRSVVGSAHRAPADVSHRGRSVGKSLHRCGRGSHRSKPGCGSPQDA